MGRSGDLPRGLVDRYRAVDGRWPDDSGCPILHVDMDAFYASVEIRERPELVGRPVVVGGVGARGVVSSANYIARRFGVRSAMPTAHARRLCPQAVFLPPTFELYQEVSAGVLAIFRDITPLVEPLSLDEAFLDVAGALRRLRSTPAAIGEQVRARVLAAHGISCSVGVGPTKFVAKLASGLAKPDGMLVVPRGEIEAFLHPLPVSALWGVGQKTEEVLLRLGLRTVGDLAHVRASTLQRAVGAAAGAHLHELAWGRDPRRVVPDEPEKSTGHEETFGTDIDDPAVIHRELLLLAERTAGRLRSGGWLARTVTIKVRFADFATLTRSRTLDVPTDVGQELYDTARALYDALGLDRARIRLVGVRAERLVEAGSAPQQLELGAREHGRREAELAADRAARRFGAGAVRPATLLHRGGRPGADQAVRRPR